MASLVTFVKRKTSKAIDETKFRTSLVSKMAIAAIGTYKNAMEWPPRSLDSGSDETSLWRSSNAARNVATVSTRKRMWNDINSRWNHPKLSKTPLPNLSLETKIDRSIGDTFNTVEYMTLVRTGIRRLHIMRRADPASTKICGLSTLLMIAFLKRWTTGDMALPTRRLVMTMKPPEAPQNGLKDYRCRISRKFSARLTSF